MNIKVIKEDVNKRLDVFLTEKFSDISRSQWQKRIKAGEVLVNGKEKLVPHYKLRVNDELQLETPASSAGRQSSPASPSEAGRAKVKTLTQKSKVKVEVIFECNDYLVINKPAGMVAAVDRVNQEKTLVDWLVEKYPEVGKIKDFNPSKGLENLKFGIVHRLDKDVSGVLVVAKSQTMFNHLKKQFQERKVDKEYMALVHKSMVQDEGEVRLPIGRSKKKGFFVAIGNVLEGLLRGRQALTKYEVVKRFKNFTLIKVKILTGRTHQIRVHLRSIGHPIVGDKLYLTRDIKKQKKQIELDRLWLYAAKLGFKDLAGEWKEFEISMPEELKSFLDKIK